MKVGEITIKAQAGSPVVAETTIDTGERFMGVLIAHALKGAGVELVHTGTEPDSLQRLHVAAKGSDLPDAINSINELIAGVQGKGTEIAHGSLTAAMLVLAQYVADESNKRHQLLQDKVERRASDLIHKVNGLEERLQGQVTNLNAQVGLNFGALQELRDLSQRHPETHAAFDARISALREQINAVEQFAKVVDSASMDRDGLASKRRIELDSEIAELRDEFSDQVNSRNSELDDMRQDFNEILIELERLRRPWWKRFLKLD